MAHDSTTDWIQALFRFLKGRIPKDFSGQVEINIVKGEVSNINTKRSFKETDT